MPGFGTLIQKDMPFNSYCVASDCSKITINFDYDSCWPLFSVMNMPSYLGNINLIVDYEDGTVTSQSLDIVSDIITNLTGLVATTAWSNVLTGTGTLFLTELSAGDYIVVNTGLYRVYSITDDEHLVMTSMASLSMSGQYVSKISLTYDVTPATMGWTTTFFTEGTYEITLEYVYPAIYSGGQTVVHTDTIEVYCENYCCVYNKLTDLADICDDCLDQDEMKKIVEALFMWAMLESFKGAAGCGDSVSLASLQARLDRYCDYQPCTHC